MTERPTIVCAGCGRMARGIAVAFAYAGYPVNIVDFKVRDAMDFARTTAETLGEVRAIVSSLGRVGLFAESDIEKIMARVSVVRESNASALAAAAVIFECLPEVIELKREVLARISRQAGPQTIIASTTSTILVDDLSSAVVNSSRFLNSHYLNPAFLVPLVEISPGRGTASVIVEQLKAVLEGIGKVPVICAAQPGYIVPRIQGLAMNEAARLVQDGVASAAEIDKAIKYGFGIRFAVLGLLEFIDWGGGDILYYGTRYLTRALGSDRYAPPEIVEQNMRNGRIGLKSRKGFFDYENIDLETYRSDRLRDFVRLLEHFGLIRPPVLS